MIFSVFDYKNRVYQYYEVKADTPPTAWFRRPIDDSKPDPNSVFSRTEVLAVKLPKNAVLTGTGLEARGVVATTQASIGSSDPSGLSPAVLRTSPWVVVGSVLLGWMIGRTGQRSKPRENPDDFAEDAYMEYGYDDYYDEYEDQE